MGDSEDYEEATAPMPKRVRIGEYLYTDGIKAETWQLTPEEVEEFFPERVNPELENGETMICYVPDCGCQVNATVGKRGMINHLRLKHAAVFVRNRGRLKKAEKVEDLKEIILEDNRRANGS
jgi:hypothetical protein